MNTAPIYAIIRLRGQVDCPYEVEYTLKLLRLNKKYHCVLYPANLPGLEGMLRKVKDWITWGEINRDTLIQLLATRGRIPGGKKLTNAYIDNKLEQLGIKGGISALADAILSNKIQLHKVDSFIKPIFRLNPPRGGFKRSVKLPYSQGGETGYRGPAINDLIMRMI